jgi:hypothetical protein
VHFASARIVNSLPKGEIPKRRKWVGFARESGFTASGNSGYQNVFPHIDSLAILISGIQVLFIIFY